MCYKCRGKSNLNVNFQKFIDWMKSHGPKCIANFDESSKAMEDQGAVDMWGRSIEKHSLPYVDFLAGDCSCHRDLVKSKPYGDEVTVQKVECVGHIQTRMGGPLRGKKEDMKG